MLNETEYYNYFDRVVSTSKQLKENKSIFELWNVFVKDISFRDFETMEKVILKYFLKGS